jgi:hypothetical protein
MKTTPYHRGFAVALATGVLLLGSACTTPPQLTAGAAERMQTHAAGIRAAAAAGEYGEAIKGLDALTEELIQAAGDGDVSFARYQSIEAAIEQLNADLAAELAAASPPSAPPNPETEQAILETQNAAGNTETPQEQPAPLPPAPVPVPLPTVPAPDPSPTSSAPVERESGQADGNGQSDKASSGNGNSDSNNADNGRGPGGDGNNGVAGKGPGSGPGKDNSDRNDK